MLKVNVDFDTFQAVDFVQVVDSCGSSGGLETPQAKPRRLQPLRKVNAARSAPKRIRQGQLEGAFSPQDGHGLS